MGSPLGPILENIFVGIFEKLLFDRFPKPYIYLRYVGHTFACFCSHNEALSFFQRLNDLYPSLTFTMDEERDNKLPFFRRLLACIWVGRLLLLSLWRLIWSSVSHSGLLRFVQITRSKENLNRLRSCFWVTGILRKSLLTTKLLINLGITSGHLALLNAQFM